MVHFHTFVDLYYLTQQFCMQQFPSSIFHAVCLFLLTPCACMQWYVLYCISLYILQFYTLKLVTQLHIIHSMCIHHLFHGFVNFRNIMHKCE